MGIESIDELMGTGKIEEKPIPKKDQICKCGHSLERHRLYNSAKNMVCIERFCTCSSFTLSRVL